MKAQSNDHYVGVNIRKNGDVYIVSGEGHICDKIFRGIEKQHYGLNRTDSGSRGVKFVVAELPPRLAALEPGESTDLPGFNGRQHRFTRSE